MKTSTSGRTPYHGHTRFGRARHVAWGYVCLRLRSSGGIISGFVLASLVFVVARSRAVAFVLDNMSRHARHARLIFNTCLLPERRCEALLFDLLPEPPVELAEAFLTKPQSLP